MSDSIKKPCWVYIENEEINFDKAVTLIKSQKIEDKKAGLKLIVRGIISNSSYPSNLMITVIQNLSVCDDHEVKKLLFLFWEVVDKRHPTGELREEFLLVCNNLRNDLNHPNEFVRARTLKLLCRIPLAEFVESLMPVIVENLSHRYMYVRRNAISCTAAMIKEHGSDILPTDVLDTLVNIVSKDTDVSCQRNAYLLISELDSKLSLKLTASIMMKVEINEIADILVLSIVRNLKKLSSSFPKEKGNIIALIMELGQHKSQAVQLEVANSLLAMTKNNGPTKVAISLLANLLTEISDNACLLVILNALLKLKTRFKELLEENIINFVYLLRVGISSQVREIASQLIVALVRESNLKSILNVVNQEIAKLKQSKNGTQ